MSENGAAVTERRRDALAATKRILTEGPAWSDADFWQRQGEITGPAFVPGTGARGRRHSRRGARR